MLNGVSRLAIASALGLVAIGAPAHGAEGKQPARPNVLLIIADDVGLDMTPGMYPGLTEKLVDQYGPDGHNHPDYKAIDGKPASTPNLDAFAKEAMVFTDAWAQPFCSPTRAAMLTGLYTVKNGVATYADALSQNHDSFVTRLRDEGDYRTAIFGKWHMAGLPSPGGAADYPGMKPKEAGFERFVGNMHAALPSFWKYQIHSQRDDTPADKWVTQDQVEHSLPGIEPTTLADVGWGADTIDWIREQEAADSDKPWFAWMAFNLAHATAGSNPSQMIIPDRDLLDDKTIAEVVACGGHFGTADPGNCSGETQMRAMTNALDTIVGKVVEAVDGIDPNTYIIIVGDNGTPMYGRPNLDFIDNMYITRKGRGKGSSYESGARVEMAVRGPGIAPGSSSSEYVHVADIYSTVLELAGFTPAKTVSNSAGDGQVALDSISLKPILMGDTTAVRDPVKDVILTESTNLMRESIKVVGARNGRFKIACTKTMEDCALYNLVDDPLEEYPLDKPTSCPADAGLPEAVDPHGNYCYLMGIAARDSIFSLDP